MSKGAEDDKSFNRVPIWNGKPEDFSHYVQEIRWFFAATKSADRPYAAARLIRRMLDSEYTALKTLMYKLDPSDFRDEDGIGKLIAFLENSPMNRQPIPDAGAKLSQYYRKLGRKSGESIPQFLVREDHAHDGMWRALQRLLREKALDFSKYDVSETELRIFCGMGDQSYYYETEMNAEEEELDEDDQASRHSGTTVNPNRSGKGSSSTSTRPGPEPKRKDLIERLMDKGLIPIAALDIIRGWMILEMTSSTDTDKALVKAATQNKLGYEAIRAALLSMHEDRDRFPRHGDKGRGRHHALHWSEDWQQSYDMQEMTSTKVKCGVQIMVNMNGKMDSMDRRKNGSLIMTNQLKTSQLSKRTIQSHQLCWHSWKKRVMVFKQCLRKTKGTFSRHVKQ